MPIRRGVSSAGCLLALVLVIVVGGWLALRSRGQKTRADRLSDGRWRPERAAAYGECERITRARLEERGLTAGFLQDDPTTHAWSKDGRTFVVQGVALAVVSGGTRREPFRCVLERDAATGGWRLADRGPG
ncbi:hypothetical protein [Roseisolibacter agri]|uniref:Uncharacterized protein n=1 Tax=Roseisolibacter agri TaxID=2014610 RepID=A0AA37V1G6_9BACT|nr:hypothetical protein [Roseisolibacter agri]GLC23757.1 hypothetical protein rosag_02700 [Roseisolibacter agri]